MEEEKWYQVLKEAGHTLCTEMSISYAMLSTRRDAVVLPAEYEKCTKEKRRRKGRGRRVEENQQQQRRGGDRD